jgi:glycosyltransferase involved in cell wall biosynthesis
MPFSVVICAFTQRRWADLGAAIASVRRQSTPAAQVLVVVDHEDELLRRAAAEHRDVQVLSNRHARGLSGARNTGVEAARGSHVAFLDDDAVADPRWLERLSAAYADEGTLGAGGRVEPSWPRGARPVWFPAEFDWVVGCTHAGMPARPSEVRNLVGANMSFRRDVLVELGGFREGIGRVGARPVGCEETELCIRAGRRWPDGRIAYVPEARVVHRVTPERATPRYFLARCRAEGWSKARVSDMVGAGDGLAAERVYVRRTLPRAVLRDVATAPRRPSALARPAAIVAGLLTTGAGYAAARARARAAAPHSARAA